MNESTLKTSVMLRMVIIAALTLLLLVPTIFVDLLVSERMDRHSTALKEVSRGWGGKQTFTGPILTLPYTEFVRTNPTDKEFSRHYAHFLPTSLNIETNITPEVRNRGIYKVALYNANIVCNGEFGTLDLDKLGINPQNVLWEEAFVTFGVSDLKGIKDSVSFTFNTTVLPFEPGIIAGNGIESGVTFKIRPEQAKTSHNFSFTLNLNGSTAIQFTPVGQTTHVTMDSPWSDPSFIGSFLPETRNITANSFRSEWKVLNLNRNFPQSWTGDKYKLTESAFGVELFLPIDEYQKTSRTIKYAILFITLTFVAFFLSEVIAKIVIHPVQYTLIGIALILFYVLLLSISEYVTFNLAYGIASAAIIGLITLYARWITSNNKIASVIFGVLMLLYSFLFVTLQLQDYALLLGSVGLFLILLLIMYLTRNIDWYSLGKPINKETGFTH